jgi:hypothetical protein
VARGVPDPNRIKDLIRTMQIAVLSFRLSATCHAPFGTWLESYEALIF